MPRTPRGAPLSTELPRSTRSVGIAAASRPPDNWYQAQLDHREMAHRWVTGVTVGGGLPDYTGLSNTAASGMAWRANATSGERMGALDTPKSAGVRLRGPLCLRC